MRFTKSEILDEFARQDRSYRLAIISSQKVLDTWVSYSDLGMLLEQDASRFSITTDFVLNQLHALIRAPFELLSDHCEDFDRAGSGSAMVKKLRDVDWYEYARAIRNTVSHNFRFDFSRYKPEKFPITWRGISLTPDLDGKTITFESFWHKSGYELFVAMRGFAEGLPE